MTNEEKMTPEEAIAYGKECLSWNQFSKDMKMYQFIEMAIKALSQEPCDDAISREMALKECHDIVVDGERYRVIQEETLLGLPPVTQKPIECDDAISRQAVFNAIEREDKWLLAAKGHNGLTEMAFSGLKARIDALLPVTQKSGKWIPVSKRLPKENETVLINYCRLNERSVRMAIWDELHCRFYNSEYTKYVSVDFVTAWMPLPEPYKAESEG